MAYILLNELLEKSSVSQYITVFVIFNTIYDQHIPYCGTQITLTHISACPKWGLQSDFPSCMS